MKRIFVGLVFVVVSISAIGQKYNPNINQTINQSDRSLQLVQTFEQFGLKTPGSAEINQTKLWLVSEYKSYGYTSVTVDSFQKNNRTYNNIVATKKGLSDEYILVCGHYDTRGGFGANDNGSGVAAILETARILADLSTTRTVKFVNFDGEEEGYTGSQYYVNQILANRDSLLYLVLNIDQIGGTKGEIGNDRIICERDENNSPMTNNGLSWMITDTLANLSRLYTNLEPQIGIVTASDYVPFENKGYTVTGLYQYANDRFGHSAADSFENMDTTSFKEAVKLSIASVLHFAQVPKFSSIKDAPVSFGSVYPNPASNQLHFKTIIPETMEIRTTTGTMVYRCNDINNNQINLPELKSGIYIVLLQKDDFFWHEKIIIQHH